MKQFVFSIINDRFGFKLWIDWPYAVNGSEREQDYFSGVLNLGSLLRRGRKRVVRLGFIIILKKSSIFAL